MKIITQKAFEIIQQFPHSKNGQPYLRLQDGRKLFLQRFVKKYGLDGSVSRYKHRDVIRRVRMVEFFDYFFKTFPIHRKEKYNSYIIESIFFRAVIVQSNRNKLELISFYPRQ